MNYKHVYCVIISHAKSEEKLGLRKKGNGTYYEAHHILPRSLFPLWENRKSNIVLLTAREHFFCHQLLTKIWPGRKMISALSQFMFRKNDNRSSFLHITSREYERFRIEFSKVQSESHKGYFDRLSEKEQNEAISKWKESMRKRTDEERKLTKEKFKLACLNKTSDEKKLEKQKRSNAQKLRFSKLTEDERKNLLGGSSRGKTWWSKGNKSIRSFECPGEGWIKGRVNIRKEV